MALGESIDFKAPIYHCMMIFTGCYPSWLDRGLDTLFALSEGLLAIFATWQQGKNPGKDPTSPLTSWHFEDFEKSVAAFAAWKMTEVTAFQYFPWWSFEPTHLESQAKAWPLSMLSTLLKGRCLWYKNRGEDVVQVTNGRHRSWSLNCRQFYRSIALMNATENNHIQSDHCLCFNTSCIIYLCLISMHETRRERGYESSNGLKLKAWLAKCRPTMPDRRDQDDQWLHMEVILWAAYPSQKKQNGQATMGNFICYRQMNEIDAEVLCSSLERGDDASSQNSQNFLESLRNHKVVGTC